MGADDFRPVRTRFIMLIPPMVVGRVLYATTQPGGLSPRDLWTEIATPLVGDDLHRDVCAPFIDWCRVAVADGVGEHNPLHSLCPSIVELGDRLDDARHTLLRQDLPRRFNPTPPAPHPLLGLPPPVAFPQAAFAPIVEVLTNLRTEYVLRSDAAVVREDARRDRPPTVATPLVRWNEALPDLLNFCQVAEAAQLLPLWAAMASQGLKLDRRTIQTHLNRKDDRYGASGQMALQINVSVSLAADLGILRFVADRADYIGMGLSIFMVSYPTVESVACLRASVEMFDRQMDSANSRSRRRIWRSDRFAGPTIASWLSHWDSSIPSPPPLWFSSSILRTGS
jgi:hypothetical protein